MYGFFEHGLWLVIRKEDNKVIGRAGIENREIDGELQKELGYLIGKPWQGKGYAAEACLAILDYVKERELCSHLFYAVIKKIFRQSASHKNWDLQFMRRILTE